MVGQEGNFRINFTCQGSPTQMPRSRSTAPIRGHRSLRASPHPLVGGARRRSLHGLASPVNWIAPKQQQFVGQGILQRRPERAVLPVLAKASSDCHVTISRTERTTFRDDARPRVRWLPHSTLQSSSPNCNTSAVVLRNHAVAMVLNSGVLQRAISAARRFFRPGLTVSTPLIVVLSQSDMCGTTELS